MASQIVSAATFACAARRYWLSVFPKLRHELRGWQTHAAAIENPRLRELAQDAQKTKRRSLEGAAAFAAFVPRSNQRSVITALTAYQLIFDYLDTVSEQPSSDPIRNGFQLNQALLAALGPREDRCDYYAHHEHRDDSGYLQALIESCRTALADLPSYSRLIVPTRRAATRSVAYQALNHGDARQSHAAFELWARSETCSGTGLTWWETGAAAGSSLATLALIGAMADPTTTRDEARALEDAYYPWIGAMHTLLDSLVDHHEDTTAPGHRSLIDYYSSPEQVAVRLKMIAVQSARRAEALPNGMRHSLILSAMASLYLSDPQASHPDAVGAKNSVLFALRPLSAPTMLVMFARRSVERLVPPSHGWVPILRLPRPTD
jgi:tetraprenyl-beta-curcumene synthase